MDKKPATQATVHERKVQFAGLLLLMLVSIASGFFGGWYGAKRQGLGAYSSTASQQIISNESQLISEIAKSVGPSVVSINVVSETSAVDFFGFDRSYEQESAGTGFIISSDGYVVTNRHVVPKGVSSVTVTLSDGTELTDVEIVGRTSESDPLDIAFLKIKDAKDKDLVPAKLGDSSKVVVGEKVVAIGNALGQFQNTVTAGIISGYGRNVEAGDETDSETLQNLFQTDTAINQGNSGGPLVNINGEVIGINTAVAGNAENIGFAIPINDVQGLVKSVLEKGELLRPYLGVRYVSLTDDAAYQLNLDTKRGAYLAPGSTGQPAVLSDTPAARAGLKEKDIITKVNDVTIDENTSLVSALGKFSVGEKVTLTIVRDGSEQKIDLTLEASPKE